jgi:hypothetical protein
MGRDIVFGGVNGETGTYLFEPMTAEHVAREAEAVLAETPSPQRAGRLPPADPDDLRQAGWCIAFAASAPPAVRRALAPLIELRKSQTGRFRQIDDYDASRDRDLPYYALLVGGPGEISFEEQSALAIDSAVGRLAFDTAAEYAAYAASVVRYEAAGTAPTAREIACWAPRHPDDDATGSIVKHLVGPLVESLEADPGGYAVTPLLGADATVRSLLGLFTRRAPPSIVFTAGHGMGFSPGSVRQRRQQGALLAQDWTGPGTIDRGQYVAADDLTDKANVHGVIALVFATYGAGTPQRLAPAPFVAALPQRLLSHPGGAALAVIAHVDRAFGSSPAPFRNAIVRLGHGERAGHAIKEISGRWLSRTADTLRALQTKASASEIARNFLERMEAQSYLCLGDPAVRIRVADLK